MLTPLLAKLREQYPGAYIAMTTPKAIAPLYQYRPYGVDAIPYDPKDIRTLLALIKQSGFDLAIVPGDNRPSWLAFALGAKWVVAFTGDRPAYKSWPVDQLIPYPDKSAAWGDMAALLAEGQKPPSVYRPKAWPDPDYQPFAFPKSRYCVLHVGARSPHRLWGKEKWMNLADYLTQRGLEVIWSAGRGEARLISAIDPKGRYASYAEKLDLMQLWHLLKRAELLVCPDTGIAHLGRLVNTPTIALFGPGSAVLFGAGEFWKNSPYCAVTIEDFPCRDQTKLFKREIKWVRHCARSIKECGSNLCMQAVNLDMVESVVEKLLGSNANSKNRVSPPMGSMK
ncbi:MAG TPA: glycosyltransferase family 9 protein [Acidiferrobacterales bacterium]|nr:glycosyltransferase family 9 protein [Acidiferrobacterales bacterium]